jgi:DNA replication protein DnaC
VVTDTDPADELPQRIDLAARVKRLQLLHPSREGDVGIDDDHEADFDAQRCAARANLWAKLMPRRYREARIEDFEDETRSAFYLPEVTRAVRAWAANERPSNLVLVGPVGTMKSYMAVAAARLRWESGLDAAFYPLVELLEQLRPNGESDAMSKAIRVNTLILDDIGSERPTDWTGEQLFLIINRRWLDESATIATCNIADPDGLKDAVGERAFSRLVGNETVVIKMLGEDRRRL